MLSGSAATFAVLNSAIFLDCASSSPVSRSTSPLKKSSVSLARSVRIRTFSCRISETSSLAPLAANSGVGAAKETPTMMAPGVPGRIVGSGSKPMNSIRSRMSEMMSPTDSSVWPA